MPVIKIARRTIAAIETPEKPVVYYDDALKGFGLLVRPSGARSWILEYRPGAGGRGTAKKRVVLGSPETATPEQARDLAKDMLAGVRLGADPAGERSKARQAETFAKIAERWFDEHVTPKRKPGTAAFYRNCLDIHVLPALGGKRASEITRQDVTRLHGAVAAGKGKGPKRPGSKRTAPEKVRGGRVIANRVLATVAATYAWALDLGLLPPGSVNPAKGVEPFREEGRERFLAPEEMARLGEVLRLAETEGLPWQPDPEKPEARRKHAPKAENRRVKIDPFAIAAIRLLMLTGARLREVLNLEWTNVDFERGLLRLPDSKTGKKTIVLGGAALLLLEGLPRPGRYVIASTSAGTEEERPRSDLNRPWRAVREAAGLPELRLHDLRHSAAAVGAGAGLSLHQIGGLLGHTQARTTARYAHLASDPQRRAADLIGKEVAAALGLGANVVPIDGGKRRDRA